MHHELKSWPKYFKAVQSGVKAFEVRKNDRKFMPNDVLLLREYDLSVSDPTSGRYTGRQITAVISYVLAEHDGLKDDYVVLGLSHIHEVVVK